MTASTIQPSPAAAVCLVPAAVEDIDASCRAPVLLLFFHALLWLLFGSVLSLLVAIKMHSGAFLADYSWLTYGRLSPAAKSIFLYGFASQAGLGVALWLLARLGRTTLVGKPAALLGGLFWNVGVILGVCGILAGDSTGFDGFEFPGYAAKVLFASYIAMGLAGMFTFAARRESSTYISQWLIFAALLVFPWIYATANALLISHPVRGMMQAVIAYWFANNFLLLWLTPLALASIFYLLPKIVNRPLYSQQLAVTGFWLLVLLGGWCGIPNGARLPSWMASLSTAGTVLMLVPILAAVINWKKTVAGDCCEARKSLPFRFIYMGAMAYVFSGFIAAGNAFRIVSQTTEFSLFTNALSQLSLYGFVAMSLFGAIYYIVPQLTKTEWLPGRAKVHFTFSGIGILLIVIGYGVGGIVQTNAQNTHADQFLQSLKASTPFIGVATLGTLALLLAHLALLTNFFSVMRRACAACCGCGKEAK